MQDEQYEGEWIGLTQAAAKAGVSKTTVRKWVKSGKLTHREINGPSGSAWEVPLDVVMDLGEKVPRREDANLPVPYEIHEGLNKAFQTMSDDLTRVREEMRKTRTDIEEAKYALGAAEQRATARAEATAEEEVRRREADARATEAESRQRELAAQMEQLATAGMFERRRLLKKFRSSTRTN
jgi:hypothetical protein